MNHIDFLEYQASIVDKSRLFLSKDPESSTHQTKKLSFLSSVSEEALVVLLEKSKTLTYPKRVLIVSEGDKANAFFIILSGKVRVFCEDEKSKEVTFNIQGPGSYFGEIALLTDKPRSVSIMTLEKTVCAVISKNDFVNWLMNYPNVAINLLIALSEEIMQLTDKVRQMALSNVYERTVKVLKDLTVDEGNIGVIHNPPSQQVLASMVGASREMISKIMRDLTKGGYVETADNSLIINRRPPSSW